MSAPPTTPQPSGNGPSFREAFLFWLKLGFISFGGPTGQIAILHEEIVERRRWISESRFLHALNYCMLLPGPEAQQLATYIGWLLHRTAGGIVAGALFVLPSAAILFGLSWIYVTWGEVREISAVFRGLQPAVLAIVAAAVVRIGRRALGNVVLWAVAGASFIAIFFFRVGFPWIILAAALLGCVAASLGWRSFQGRQGHQGNGGGKEPSPEADLAATSASHARPTWGRAVRVLATCLVLWWAPVLGLALWLGPDHAVVREGIFFSKAALVTFGGAYAVLPYVSQRAVEAYGWLSAPQMLDGLGLAETTPGPLIMVLQFVGFLGGWNHPGALSPLAAAALGSFVSTWTTFLPCFLWIFLGAPHIEQLRGNRRLGGALTAVTAAVVGVVLNLAVWFGAHVLVPAPGKVDWISVLVAGATLVGLVRWKWRVPAVVLGGGLVGLAREFLGA